MVRVAVSNMYAEFTKILSRAAVDPRDFALVAFGGAGPVVGALARPRGRHPHRLRPALAGDALRARRDQRRHRERRRAHGARVARGRPRPLVRRPRRSPRAVRRAPGRAGGLARAPRRRRGAATFRHAADMRYVGQSYEIEVPVEPAWLVPGGGAPLLAAFHRAHERAFGHADREAPAEIVNLRVQLRAGRPRVPLGEIPAARGVPGAPRDAPDLARRPPDRGARLRPRRARRAARAWPARPSSSSRTRPCWCPRGHVGEVDRFGNLMLRREG